MKRSGASHFARFCLPVFSALLLALPVLAEDKPQPRGLREGVTFISSAAVVEVHERGGETAVVLLGDAHVLIEVEPEAKHEKKPGEPATEKQLIDLRAENAVVYVPLRPADLRGGTVVRGFPFLLDHLPMRALYAEGNVRLEQKILNGKGKRALEGPSVLEASQVYLDVVSERIYAQDASARLSAGAKRLPSAGTSTSTKGPSQEAAFTLRAESMRIRGADAIDADKASLSVCDFGFPHEALEAERLVLVAPEKRQKLPAAASASAAIGGIGATVIAQSARRDQPFEALRDVLREGKERAPEGSDALFHTRRNARWIEGDGLALRLRPPFFGEEGIAVPLPFPVGWDTDWLFPTIRIGHSSRFGYFGLAELKVPIVREELVHEADGTSHVEKGLGLDALVAPEGYTQRGPGGELGAQWEYRNEDGVRVARGMAKGFFMKDSATVDRDTAPITEDDRYWLRALHQQDLPGGVHLDAEASKQSDRDLLLEYFRNVAFREKEQETYVYLRRTFADLGLDDLGARFTWKWRLNDFQSQTEELPRFRVDWISTPVLVLDTLGGLYFTAGIEGAHFRRRLDDALETPDARVGRGDFDGRLDYKLSLLDLAYVRAYGEGRYTAWSDGAADKGALDRFLAMGGTKISTQADATFPIAEKLVLRHVIEPEAGYEDRRIVTRQPEDLIQIDEIETYREGQFVFGRLRNRLQIGKDENGKGAQDLLDLAIEGRYFPTRERLQPGRAIWGTLLGDGRLYAPDGLGSWRTEVEMDPTRNRVIRLDSTLSWQVTRSWLSLTREDGKKEKRSGYPDISIQLSYNEVADIVKAVGWGATIRFTPSWSFHVEEQYDLTNRNFLIHRASVTRFFHGFALEVTGTYNPLLHDTSFSFSFSPRFEAEDRDPFRDGRYGGLGY